MDSRWVAAGAAALLLSSFFGGYPATSAASPDANNGLIAFWTGYNIRAMNPDGTSVHYLASAGDTAALRYSAPAWSPNGQQIAFERTGDIAVADWRGNGIHPLTDTPAPVSESDPAWSPDGTQIAFARGEAIWVMDADGTNQHQVTTGCCNGYPTWSPDGGTIAFRATEAAPGRSTPWTWPPVSRLCS